MKYLSAAILSVTLITASLLLISWGQTGHYKISYESGQSFNAEMLQLQSWAVFLAEHASDADIRKQTDPDEGPRHYIDLDNYPGFAETGQIPHSFDSAVSLYGYPFVISQGVLPWATLTTCDSLVACFERRDWSRAQLFASDLGHYVADGHMPLHVTRNYDGQFTGNDGIHHRYESSMINAYIGQIGYGGMSAEKVDDVAAFVFGYLYANYELIDSILSADVYARNLAGGTGSSAYKQALWEKTGAMTTDLFYRASNALARLIYTAWIEAGSPLIEPQGITDDAGQPINISLGPNPFRDRARISINPEKPSQVSLRVYDAKGNELETIFEGLMEAGSHSFDWSPAGNGAGMFYFILLSADGKRSVGKLLQVR
jgi:hypothetical protein